VGERAAIRLKYNENSFLNLMKLKVQTKKKFKLTLNEQQAKWLVSFLEVERTYPEEHIEEDEFANELLVKLHKELMQVRGM